MLCSISCLSVYYELGVLRVDGLNGRINAPKVALIYCVSKTYFIFLFPQVLGREVYEGDTNNNCIVHFWRCYIYIHSNDGVGCKVYLLN